jgi:hypothetical protein
VGFQQKIISLFEHFSAILHYQKTANYREEVHANLNMVFIRIKGIFLTFTELQIWHYQLH